MACLSYRDGSSAEPLPFAEPGARPHYAPDRVVRITRATIRLTVDPATATFSGVGEYSLDALPTFDGSFSLDLDEVEVEQVTAEGAAVDWVHEDGRLVIRAETVPQELVVRWRGANPRRGLYFTGPTPSEPDRAHMAWTQCQDEDGHVVFPCHDHPSVKHPWTLELVAPAGYTLLSNGKQVGSGELGDQVWARFEQEEPMPAYLVTFVAAQLTVMAASWNGKPVRYFVPVGQERNVERAFGRTPAMLDHFSHLLGVPYPWPRYDQVVVHDFVFGGMENVSCTTMTDVLLMDEKAELDGQPDSLVAHELAHQWFGDLVTCQDWSQGWLNESWATYMEALWWESSRPAEEATWYRWSTAAGYLDEHDNRYRRPIVAYDFREPIDLFDRHLYNKGSCVLWTLRHQLGTEAFFAGVRLYLERHAHSTVHTRHFQRALEDASGTNLDGFFHQWVHRAGHPQLTVEVSREGSNLCVTVVQKQGSGDDEVFAFPLRLVIVEPDGERIVDLAVRERQRTYVIPSAADAHVRVDPGYRVLATVELKGSDAWLERLSQDACPVLAVRACRALLTLGTPRALAAAERALTEHPFWGVRATVAGALASRGTEQAMQHVIGRLAEEEEPRALRALATAVGKWRTPEAADALIALLERGLPTWQSMGAALVALGKTRDPRAADVLRTHLDTNSWADIVRQRALEGLAATQDEAVLADLSRHTEPGHSDRARAAAAQGLAALGEVSSEAVRRTVLERLVELVREPGFRVQSATIAALGRLGDPAAIGPLQQVHASAADGRAKRTAYEAMMRIRRGRTTEEGLSTLRRRMEEVATDVSKLRSRLDRMS
ncbi:MAG: M1 family metallopeptidase [Myxococcales bacterium]|nr:M1 family metallopeptidase [Myxococcales bacterium]